MSDYKSTTKQPYPVGTDLVHLSANMPYIYGKISLQSELPRPSKVLLCNSQLLANFGYNLPIEVLTSPYYCNNESDCIKSNFRKMRLSEAVIVSIYRHRLAVTIIRKL